MHVHALWTYPLKGARGTPHDAVEVRPAGFAGDRRWMLVDAAGTFVSQRQHARLALLEAAAMQHGGLRLAAPGLDPLDVAVPTTAERLPVRIWSDVVAAAPAGEEAHAWVSAFLGQATRLVWFPDDAHRQVDAHYVPEGAPVHFADGYPVLVTTTASLGSLNARLEVPVPMDRFRPSLVVDGALPFEEDHWGRLQAGVVVLRLVKPCARCRVTTVDQATGAVGAEPLRTLARFRSVEGKVYFGHNAVVEQGGRVECGMPVTVLTRG